MKTPNINAILSAQPRSSIYGAPMGYTNDYADDGRPCYVQRVRMVDGDYSPDGTYWGGASVRDNVPYLWCAFSDMTRVFIRAWTRQEAKRLLVVTYHTMTFRK